MTVYFTAVHMEPTTASDHEHIASVRWLNAADSTSKVFSTAAAVAWIRKGNVAVVADQDGPVEVSVVATDPPYLRTQRDGRPTNNLLQLPRF